MADDVQERDIELLKNHVAMLQEHFDTVQIFVTRHSGEDGTIRASWGGGDYYARYGNAALWVKTQERPEPEDD